MKLVLGDKNLSSWSLRPWLVMRHANIPFEEEVLRFEREDWQEAIAARSPTRRVPALHDGDLVVWESLAICEYLAERFPDAGLWPEDARDRATARALSAEMHAGFTSLRREMPMDVVLRAPRRTLPAETRRDVDRVLAIWSRAKGPFLFGAPTIADAMFAPVVFRFRTYGVSIEDPTARAYYEAMLALPAMQAWERDAAAEVAGGRGRGPTGERYAVVFTSRLRGAPAGYEETARRMEELAAGQPGFLGIASARGADGLGITVSYWDSLDAVRRWKEDPEHALAQARGRESYYEKFVIDVCAVERSHRFP